MDITVVKGLSFDKVLLEMASTLDEVDTSQSGKPIIFTLKRKRMWFCFYVFSSLSLLLYSSPTDHNQPTIDQAYMTLMLV